MTANPITARELKERMRSNRAPVVLTLYLLLLGAIAFAIERSVTNQESFAGDLSSSAAGRTLFHWLLLFVLVFICFMVPAFTASAISIERERQTLHLVQVTLMRPRSIVIGKLLASISWLVLLVIATVPLVSVSFVLGGVTPLDVIRGYAMVLLTGVTIAAIGVAMSALFHRTVASIVMTFMVVSGLTVGTVVGYALVRTWAQHRYQQQLVERLGRADDLRPPREPTWTVALNPFVGTASAIQGTETGSRGGTPFEAMFSFLSHTDGERLQERGVIIEDGGVFVQRGEVIERQIVPRPGPDAEPAARARRVPMWGWTVLWYVVITAGSIVLASAAVTSPKRVFRSGRRGRRATETS